MISAALSPGICSELLAMAEEKAFSLYLSGEILAEVTETLAEPEIGMNLKKIKEIYQEGAKNCTDYRQAKNCQCLQACEDCEGPGVYGDSGI